MHQLRSNGVAASRSATASVLVLATVGLFLCPVRVASAQQTPDHPALDRYNRAAKGANVEEWKRRLGDEDVRRRIEAVDSLGTKGGEEAIRPLIEATADADYRVRIKAIDYLGFMRAKEASPVLMQMLFLSDVGREEKLRSLTALGRIADPATGTRLLNYARTIEDDALVSRALFALGEIGDPAARGGIEEIARAHPDEEMQRLAADAMAKIEQKQQLRPVEQPTLIELEKKLAPRQPQR